MPIQKTDWKDDPKNYSPVRLTSAPGKVMEQIILSDITQYLQDNQAQATWIYERQVLSTDLISLYDKVNCLADEGWVVDVVCLDFRKAFDTVSYSILLQEKLTAHGSDRGTLLWVKNCLDGQTQRVVVNGEKSSWWPVATGDPQGSVLGPLLLNIFIDALDMGLKCMPSKFVEDTEHSGSVDLSENGKGLQRNLDKFGQWAEENFRGVNTVKGPALGSQQAPCSATGLGSEPLTLK